MSIKVDSNNLASGNNCRMSCVPLRGTNENEENNQGAAESVISGSSPSPQTLLSSLIARRNSVQNAELGQIHSLLRGSNPDASGVSNGPRSGGGALNGLLAQALASQSEQHFIHHRQTTSSPLDITNSIYSRSQVAGQNPILGLQEQLQRANAASLLGADGNQSHQAGGLSAVLNRGAPSFLEQAATMSLVSVLRQQVGLRVSTQTQVPVGGGLNYDDSMIDQASLTVALMAGATMNRQQTLRPVLGTAYLQRYLAAASAQSAGGAELVLPLHAHCGLISKNLADTLQSLTPDVLLSQQWTPEGSLSGSLASLLAWKQQGLVNHNNVAGSTAQAISATKSSETALLPTEHHHSRKRPPPSTKNEERNDVLPPVKKRKEKAKRPPPKLPSRPVELTHRPSIGLAIDTDEGKLSPYQCFLREQIEVFETTLDHVGGKAQGRNTPIVAGQVGIQCKHCSKIPLHSRMSGSVFYSQTLDGLYQIAQNMCKTHFLTRCPNIPEQTKEHLSKLQKNLNRGSGGKAYWRQAAKKLGIVEDDNILKFTKAVSSANKAEAQTSHSLSTTS